MKTHYARAVNGETANFWLAFRCSYQWGGAYEDGHSESFEQLIDADVDANKLRERVNKHFAHPVIVNFERGNKLEIPPFAMMSERKFGSGGGCNYHAWLEIRPAPTVTTEDCPDCNGVGSIPNSDPKKKDNRYFNVQCTRCNGSRMI